MKKEATSTQPIKKIGAEKKKKGIKRQKESCNRQAQ